MQPSLTRIVAPLPVIALTLLGACGGAKEKEAEISQEPRVTSVEVGELEITSYGVDRFTHCPPAGDLGQAWIPKPFPFTPSQAAEAPKPASSEAPASYIDLHGPTDRRTTTELAVEETHRDFRSCWRKSLVHGGSDSGRVAVVLRVLPDGHVAKVEEYGACSLPSDAIQCMMDTAGHLRFAPSETGDTITIPAVFTPRSGPDDGHSASTDGYTAGAYVTIEEARPALHACEDTAVRQMRSDETAATYEIDVAHDGSVLHVHAEPRYGDRPLILCGAEALAKLRFDPPTREAGHVSARIVFNPRQGSR